MMTYVFIAIGVAIMTALFLYVDSRLFDKPKKKQTYFKVICMNIAVVLATVYLLEWLSPTSNIKDVVKSTSSTPKIVPSGPVVKVPEIGEEMIGGDAQF